MEREKASQRGLNTERAATDQMEKELSPAEARSLEPNPGLLYGV